MQITERIKIIVVKTVQSRSRQFWNLERLYSESRRIAREVLDATPACEGWKERDDLRDYAAKCEAVVLVGLAMQLQAMYGHYGFLSGIDYLPDLEVSQ